MKEILLLAFCLCTLFTLGFVGEKQVLSEERTNITRMADRKEPDVREGGPNEGIYLLSSVLSK